MKRSICFAIALTALASSSTFAQGKTRAEVYQELIQAQENGLNFVTDASYPDVSPVFASQVARMKQEHRVRQNAASSETSGPAATTR
jgi:hypothetical protein